MAGILTLQPEGRGLPDVGTQVQNGEPGEAKFGSRFGTQLVSKGKARETLGLWADSEKSPRSKAGTRARGLVA